MEKITDSKLLFKILKTLNDLENEKFGIRISISNDPVEVSKKTGEKELIKYLCWNIIDENQEYVTDPILATVHATLTHEVIFNDLSYLFPSRKFIVDDEIYLEDD